MSARDFKISVYDCDAFNLVVYPKYVEFINKVKRAFFAEKGIPVNAIASLGVDIVTSQFLLLNSGVCRDGDTIRVICEPKYISRDGLKLNYRGFNIVNDNEVFTAKTDLIFLSGSGAKISLPDDIFTKLDS